MRVKLIAIVNAYNNFVTLTKKRYSNWGTALKLANAARELEQNKDFYLEKEKDLLNAYVLKNEEGKLQFTQYGQPKFKSVEDAQNFNNELISLQRTEVDVFDPIVIPVSDFKIGEDTLTPEEIKSVSYFVTFTFDKSGGEA